MDAYMQTLKELSTLGAFGFSVVSVLYYLNQAAKKVGYIPAKWVLALTFAESAAFVLTFYFVPLVFVLLFGILGMTAAVVGFHDAMKDKAGGDKPPTA